MSCLVILSIGFNYLVEGFGVVYLYIGISKAALGLDGGNWGSASEFDSSAFSVVLVEPNIRLGTVVTPAIFNFVR